MTNLENDKSPLDYLFYVLFTLVSCIKTCLSNWYILRIKGSDSNLNFVHFEMLL